MACLHALWRPTYLKGKRPVTGTAPLPTLFLPAERAPEEVVRAQAELFRNSPLMTEMLDGAPDLLLVLNHCRQIVFANQQVVELTGVGERSELYGQRPGEALGCIYATEHRGGCGTAEACRTCGAAHAIRSGLAGSEATEDCRLLRGPRRDPLDLRAWARPLSLNGEAFTVFSLVDTGDEQRRQALERVFFHDLLNTAGALRGLVEELAETDGQGAHELAMVHQLADELIDEIQAQRTLSAAERGELVPELATVDLASLLTRLVGRYQRLSLGRQRQLQLDLADDLPPLTTDTTLVRRIAANLLKNALEASRPGDTVTVAARAVDDGVEVWVHNPQVMPRAVQLQVFRRSFSTKGPGRGLGTYGVRLLGERYLRGRVGFASDDGHGTTFRVWLPRVLTA